MSLLVNTSVRTILATVFLVLATGLCTALAWQLYTAWELTQSAARAATLAGADKAVFAATYAIRQQRSDVQGAFQAPGDFAKAVTGLETAPQPTPGHSEFYCVGA